jgi:hypothetical protein
VERLMLITDEVNHCQVRKYGILKRFAYQRDIPHPLTIKVRRLSRVAVFNQL